MIKASSVVFISEQLEKDFNSLKEDDPIKKAMVRAIQDLKENAFSGIQLPKRLFPKEYIQKYCINNLLEIRPSTRLEIDVHRDCG